MSGASASGPAAQTRRPGGDASRAARTPGAAASSTTRGREGEGNLTARLRYQLRPPHDEVAEAARTGEWQPCMRWVLGRLKKAVKQGAEVADFVGLSMGEGGTRMQEWLDTAVTSRKQWDLECSQLMATAYLHTLTLQLTLQPPFPPKSPEAGTMSKFTSNMRDVIIVGAIIKAGSHRNKEDLITALQDIFQGRLSKDMNAQMQHSYHQLLKGASYAYQSTCARGRRRPARIRPSHDESATDVATEDEPEADEADESDAAETSAAESSESAPLRSKAVLRHIEAERTKLWRGMCGLEARQQRDQDARLELEMQLRMLCEEIRGLKAHATRLEAKVAHLEAQQGKSAPCPLSTPCPYPAAVQSEEWLRRNPAPFGDSSQVVEIPILCLRWRGWDCDYMNKAMTSQPSQPEEVLGQQCADVPVTFHEPLGVVQHRRFFWVLAADAEQQKKLAAVAMFQALSKHKMVMTPCKICRGSLRGSSSSAAPAHCDSDLSAAADFSDEELLGSGFYKALSDQEQP